LVKISNIS